MHGWWWFPLCKPSSNPELTTNQQGFWGLLVWTCLLGMANDISTHVLHILKSIDNWECSVRHCGKVTTYQAGCLTRRDWDAHIRQTIPRGMWPGACLNRQDQVRRFFKRWFQEENTELGWKNTLHGFSRKVRKRNSESKKNRKVERLHIVLRKVGKSKNRRVKQLKGGNVSYWISKSRQVKKWNCFIIIEFLKVERSKLFFFFFLRSIEYVKSYVLFLR